MGKSILTSNQKRFLAEASKNQEIIDRFYLTGGTALSEFYLQHRLSEDLDFFSEKPFDEKIVLEWAKKAGKKLFIPEIEYKVLKGQHTFFFNFSDEVVKVDFAYFPFPHIGDFKKQNNLRISSIEDIAVNKIQAIITRNRGRDYYDLFAIIKRQSSNLETVRKQYRLKFDVNISDEELAKVCSDVLDAKDMPRFLGRVDWAKVETFFLNEAKKLQKKILKN